MLLTDKISIGTYSVNSTVFSDGIMINYLALFI